MIHINLNVVLTLKRLSARKAKYPGKTNLANENNENTEQFSKQLTSALILREYFRLS